jgi:hypothetical protein
MQFYLYGALPNLDRLEGKVFFVIYYLPLEDYLEKKMAIFYMEEIH